MVMPVELYMFNMFTMFDLAALCGCHTLNVCYVMLCYHGTFLYVQGRTIGAHYIGCHGLIFGWDSFSRYAEKDHYIMRYIRIYGYMLVFLAL